MKSLFRLLDKTLIFFYIKLKFGFHFTYLGILLSLISRPNPVYPQKGELIALLNRILFHYTNVLTVSSALYPVSWTRLHTAHTWQPSFKQSIFLMFHTAVPTNTRINILSGQLTVTTDQREKKRKEKEKSHTR